MNFTQSISVGDLVRGHARSFPLQTATIYNERRVSYPELDHRTTRLANALRGAGCGEGGRILWLGQNLDRLFEVVLAAAKIGAVVCPANWRFSIYEMIHAIDDMEPHVIFWQQEEVGDTVSGALAQAACAQGVPQILVDGTDSDFYEDFLQSGSAEDDEAFIDPDLPLLQIYTAAISGYPQGALLSHRAILTQSVLFGLLQEIDCDYIFLNSGPLFHVGVWMTTWPTFIFGGTNIFVRRVDAEEICALIDREKITGAYLVGVTQDQMVALNKDGKYSLKSLVGTAHTPEWNQMITLGTSRWHKGLMGYGQSEVTGLITFNCFGSNMQGMFGRASPLAVVRLVDEEGNEVPVGEVGEFAIRGPTVMNGYHQKGGAPQPRITKNGWHRTTDLGRREADGSFSFVGTNTRMLKSGVENIFPKELEMVINGIDGVTESAIIGTPHDKWIQTVVAIVVREPGASVDEAVVIARCKERLASFKKPTKVIFVDKLPRLASGDIDYRELDERFDGGNYPGGNTRSR